MDIATICITMAIRILVLQETPQLVERVTEYQSCISDNYLSNKAIQSLMVDGHVVKLEDPDTIYNLDIGSR